MTERAECPVPIQRGAYVFPTIGIAMIAFLAAGFICAISGMLLGRLAADGMFANPLFDRLALLVPAACGGTAAAWWIHRMQRIHRERKIVIDETGITYVAFAGKARVMRWTDIQRAEEVEEYGQGEGTSMIYRLVDRSFSARDCDFRGYAELRRLTKKYLPDRTTLMR